MSHVQYLLSSGHRAAHGLTSLAAALTSSWQTCEVAWSTACCRADMRAHMMLHIQYDDRWYTAIACFICGLSCASATLRSIQYTHDIYTYVHVHCVERLLIATAN
jgi:hypothetical protein